MPSKISPHPELSYKERQKIASKKYKDSHKEKTSAQWQEYYTLHKEEIKAKRKERYAHNKELEIKKAKLWQSNNKEKVALSRSRYQKENREKLNLAYHSRITKDPAFKIRIRLSNQLSKYVRGKYKNTHSLSLLGCTIAEFKEHLEYLFQTGMSWDNYGKSGWHIDHIKPCAAFDLTKEEEQKACFHYTNMQPLWAKDNITKGKKYYGE